jgi:hypothetical protein
MAKTYVGYVKREVANEIDWASIGSGISDMLLEERDAREAKKKEIDDASREFAKVLTDAEGSEHTGINQFFLDGANSIQEVRLMQDRLLRSGQLRLKDYNVQRQNAIDGTNEMLALVKGYDTKYKEKMERLQSGVSAAQEQYMMEQIEGFSNFQNHRLYVNPTNGQFSIGKTVPGKGGINELSKNPNDFSTMQALKNRLNIKIDKYDWNKNVQQGVDNLAKIVLAKNAGGVKTEEDARLSDEYKSAKSNWIDSMMTNSTNVGSMLTDWIGGYSFTQDSFEAGQDDSKILLVPDPRQPSSGNLVPKLSDAQEKIVKQRLEQEFESRVDKIQTAMPTQRQAPLSAGERTAQQEGEIGFGLALDLTSGGGIAGESLEKIKANNNAIDNVYETETSYVIQYKDGSEDKTINKIMRDGVEAREETAVSLMAAVNPNYDATKAETAKQRYLKTNTIGERKEKGLFGKRTAISSQNTSTYQTKSEVSKGDKGVSISQQIEKLPTPDEDNAGQVLDVIKDIYPLPGTESFINQIQVTGVGTGIQDALNIKLPEEFIPFVKDVGGVKVDGQNVKFDYDAKKDKATLRNVIDGIIAGMYDIYNKSDARKPPEDNPGVVSPEAGTSTGTTTGTTTTDNNTSGAAKFNP